MTAIQRYDNAPGSLADTMKIGDILSKSGFFADSRDAAQAVTKILAGQELGIGPIAAMTGINIIKGRVAISANLMAAQVKRGGRYNYRVLRLDDKACELVFFEGSQEIGRSVFTTEDAKRAGTQNMDRFPRNMLFARAMSNGVKWFTPDIFTGPVYTPEELGGDQVVDVSPAPAPALPAVAATPAPYTPEPEAYTVDGVVSDIQHKKSARGVASLLFKVNGVPLVLKVADFPDIDTLANGDEATVIYHEEGEKRIAVVDDIRFTKPESDEEPGATFEAIEVPDEEPA